LFHHSPHEREEITEKFGSVELAFLNPHAELVVGIADMPAQHFHSLEAGSGQVENVYQGLPFLGELLFLCVHFSFSDGQDVGCDDLGGRWAIVHRCFARKRASAFSIKSKSSNSISAARRPRLASSMLATRPERCLSAWAMQPTPQRKFPRISQKATACWSTGTG